MSDFEIVSILIFTTAMTPHRCAETARPRPASLHVVRAAARRARLEGGQLGAVARRGAGETGAGAAGEAEPAAW